jgi:GT2 family glycosyltransferase
MASPLIWIVVLNWNGLSDTLACLESLQDVRYKPCRVVVVDNGSTDGSVDALRTAQSRLKFEIIEAGRNFGYAGGNNLGIRYALDHEADFVFILNNDTTVDTMVLDELVKAAEEHPETGCFGPWVFYMHDPRRLWWAGAAWSTRALAFTCPGRGRLADDVSPERARADAIVGAALFFRASVPREIGLLDERFFLCNEEYDWCCRARRAGFQCLTVPTAHVWHKVSASFGGAASPLINYFDIRNKLLFTEKNASRLELLRLLLRGIRRFWPPLHVERRPGVSMLKAVFWGCRSHLRDWPRRLHDPQEIAHRRAVRDYVGRRFGDCPPEVRALNDGWVVARAQGSRPVPADRNVHRPI